MLWAFVVVRACRRRISGPSTAFSRSAPPRRACRSKCRDFEDTAWAFWGGTRSVCVTPYQHIYIYISLSHTHKYIHTCIHTYIHTYIYAYIHTYIHTYTHTHTNSIYIYIYICYACICMIICLLICLLSCLLANNHKCKPYTDKYKFTYKLM